MAMNGTNCGFLVSMGLPIEGSSHPVADKRLQPIQETVIQSDHCLSLKSGSGGHRCHLDYDHLFRGNSKDSA